LSLWPSKKQWNTWSLPSKLTAIGVLLAILALGFYFLEKGLNIYAWIFQNRPKPMVTVGIQFPYERVDGSVRQNKRNPQLTITNTGTSTISPIIVDVSMFVLSPSLDMVLSASYLKYRTHGHLIFESELKPGSSVNASLVGILNWTKPAAYRVNTQVIVQNNEKIPILSLLYLIDENGIKGEGLKLSKSVTQKIKAAILAFENSNNDKKIFTLDAPIDGVWVAHAEPGVNMHLNKDRTLTVK
jgi:hypothetical protein